MDVFAPYPKINGSFIVRNITPDRKKTIKIFNYYINYNDTRDLMLLPGVSEADIRASLIKGEIRNKLLAKDIVVEYSDIDLLQFNDDHYQFLKDGGVTVGLKITQDQMAVVRKEDVQLIGDVNDVNVIFTIPSGVFIQNDLYRIIVYKNGVKQVYLDDYLIAEGNGVGTGYQTVIMTSPPSAVLPPPDIITADYYVSNV